MKKPKIKPRFAPAIITKRGRIKYVYVHEWLPWTLARQAVNPDKGESVHKVLIISAPKRRKRK